MKRIKYKIILVHRRINVSSSGHYTAKVTWVGGTRWYGFSEGFMTNHEYNAVEWRGAPQYLINEVKRQIVRLIEDKTAIFFEYDRDRNERTEGLRYFDPEMVQWWATKFTEELQSPITLKSKPLGSLSIYSEKLQE